MFGIINGLNAIITLATSIFNAGEIFHSLELPEITGDVDWEFVPRAVPEDVIIEQPTSLWLIGLTTGAVLIGVTYLILRYVSNNDIPVEGGGDIIIPLNPEEAAVVEAFANELPQGAILEKGGEYPLTEKIYYHSVLEEGFLSESFFYQLVEIYTWTFIIVFILLLIAIARRYNFKKACFLFFQLIITKGLVGGIFLGVKTYCRVGFLSVAPILGQLDETVVQQVLCFLIFLGISTLVIFFMSTWRVSAVFLSEGEHKVDWVFWTGAYISIYLIGGLILLFIKLVLQ
jgi:hypothetical protein